MLLLSGVARVAPLDCMAARRRAEVSKLLAVLLFWRLEMVDRSSSVTAGMKVGAGSGEVTSGNGVRCKQ